MPAVLSYGTIILRTLGFTTNKSATLANCFVGIIFNTRGCFLDLHTKLLFVGVGIAKFIATMLALWKIDIYGRRMFLTSGVMLMTFCLGVLAAVGRELEHDEDSLRKWISFAAVVCFNMGYSFSFGVVSWLLLGELFPDSVRSYAISIAMLFNWTGNMIVSMTFLSLLDAIKASGVFFLYALVCICALIFIYFFIPETAKRTLDGITMTHLRASAVASQELEGKGPDENEGIIILPYIYTYII